MLQLPSDIHQVSFHINFHKKVYTFVYLHLFHMLVSSTTRCQYWRQ